MIWVLDSTSAGVFATVFSTLLIALAVRKPLPIPSQTPRWLKISTRILDVIYMAAILGAIASVLSCLSVVADDSRPHWFADWATSITAILMGFAIGSWITEHMVRWRSSDDH